MAATQATDGSDTEEEEITAATLRGKPRPLPLSATSAFSYIPPRRQDPKEHSYYNRQSKVLQLEEIISSITIRKIKSNQTDQARVRDLMLPDGDIGSGVIAGGFKTTGMPSLTYETGVVSLYDCVFKRRLDYNQKLHRDDREHAKGLGLHISEEEQERPVGVLTSSVYGKRINQPIEPLNRDHGRVNHVQADFYRKNDIPSIKEPGFGHISPT